MALTFFTVAEVAAQITALVGDGSGQWTDPSVLYPFIYAAYRDTQKLIRAGGASILRKISDEITVSGSLGVNRILRTAGSGTDSVTPYPDDLIRPLEIVERVSTLGTTFSRMSQSDGIPEEGIYADDSLGEWDWIDDAIVFPRLGTGGASVKVKILYDAALPDLGPSSTLAIPDGDDAVINLAAAYALRSRGGQSGLADDLQNRAQMEIASIVQSDIEMRIAAAGRWGDFDYPFVAGAVTAQGVIRSVSALVNTKLPAGARPLSDARLFVFVRMAYDDLVAWLKSQGTLYFMRVQVVQHIPAATTTLSRTSSPALPSDFSYPVLIREDHDVTTADSLGGFARMEPVGLTGINSRQLSRASRGYYRWSDDQLTFPAGEFDADMEITYEARVSPLVTSRSALARPEFAPAVAARAAAYVFMAREQNPQELNLRADALQEDLLLADKRARDTSLGQFGARIPPS